MRFIVITILFFLTSVLCFGQSLKSLNEPENISSKEYFLPSILKENPNHFTNNIHNLKDTTINTLILNERIENVDSTIEVLKQSNNLKFIAFSPTQNPEIAKNLGLFPNLEGYKLYVPRCLSYALPNLGNLRIKTLPCLDYQSMFSWPNEYSKELNEIFEQIKYIHIVDKLVKAAPSFDRFLFQNVQFIDVTYDLANWFSNETIERLSYKLNTYSILNNDLPRLKHLESIRFNGIPEFIGDKIDVIGAPNLNFLAFYNCNLPGTINLNNITLKTLVFWGSSKLPKLEKADSISTLKTLLISGNNKRLKNLKIHQRFISIEQLGIKGYKTGINSRKLSKLNQLTHYELYGVKDRSLGFKLPKKKNNLTTLKIEKSGLWWPPKNLEEYKNLDTLVLEVAFYRKKRLKKALLNLPNLKYVKISKSWIKGVAPNNKAFTVRHVEGDGVYTKLEWEIKENHPNDSLYLDIESKEYPLYYKNSPELESK